MPYRSAMPMKVVNGECCQCCQLPMLPIANVANCQCCQLPIYFIKEFHFLILSILLILSKNCASRPSCLLLMGNNYLKQLAFGARANSPVFIFHLKIEWICCAGAEKARESYPAHLFKVVFTSCPSCFQS